MVAARWKETDMTLIRVNPASVQTYGTTAQATFEAMRAMLTSKGQDPGDEEVLGDGVALAGVARYPARVKCALLGWSAFTDALARAGVDISSISSGHATHSTPTSQEGTS